MLNKTIVLKPVLFYNDYVSKMTVVFPQVSNQFEMYLHKQNNLDLYSRNRRLGRSNKNERVYSPFAHTPRGGTIDRKWWSAKFVITKNGKFRARLYSKQYANVIKHDLRGVPIPIYTYYYKDAQGILNRRCKF